ncbi:MAG: hypothetical protein PVG49_09275 [Desulfobacteraceae bacterium]
MRIFITGCARSGTTLLRRLFHAFRDTRVVPYEIDLDAFAAMEAPKGTVLVGKRTVGTVFSNCLDADEGKRQIMLLRTRSDIRVLNIFRDGRDVVESEFASPLRWYESLRQMILAEENGLLPTLGTLKYEDLVGDPDGTQKGVAAWYELEIEHLWSDYPAFFPGDDHVGRYTPRPIGTHRVGKDPTKYRRLDPWLAPRIDLMLRHLGYLKEAA